MISAVLYCPHTPEQKCQCRKPNIGLFARAKDRFGISLRDSWFIGDKLSDAEAGGKAGCRTLIIPSNSRGALLGASKVLVHNGQVVGETDFFER